jgi:hypothetical protein
MALDVKYLVSVGSSFVICNDAVGNRHATLIHTLMGRGGEGTVKD